MQQPDLAVATGSLALVDCAHELVRELREISGLACCLQGSITAGGSALLVALHCLLSECECLQDRLGNEA